MCGSISLYVVLCECCPFKLLLWLLDNLSCAVSLCQDVSAAPHLSCFPADLPVSVCQFVSACSFSGCLLFADLSCYISACQDVSTISYSYYLVSADLFLLTRMLVLLFTCPLLTFFCVFFPRMWVLFLVHSICHLLTLFLCLCLLGCEYHPLFIPCLLTFLPVSAC